MRIGILKTDSVLPELARVYGEYPEMFSNLLRGVDSTLEFETWDVARGEIPSDPATCDAWLITGSRRSIYEEEPWIAPLEQYVRRLHDEKRRLVAICFGHQLVARALGGRAGKADQGWTIGVQDLEIDTPFTWLDDAPSTIRLIHSHQDQVLELPSGAVRVATTPACPLAMFQIGNHIMAVQGHPEFTPEYAGELYEKRRKLFGERLYEEARTSLDEGHDSRVLAEWIVRFLHAKIQT